MNIKFFLKSFGVLLAASLIAYAFGWLGVEGAVVDSLWKLLALDIGLSLAAAFAWPHIRGVRKGDALAMDTPAASVGMPGISFVISSFGMANAYANSNGRVGDKIKIRTVGGARGEARILEYSGLFSPAKVQLLEIERPQAAVATQ